MAKFITSSNYVEMQLSFRKCVLEVEARPHTLLTRDLDEPSSAQCSASCLDQLTPIKRYIKNISVVLGPVLFFFFTGKSYSCVRSFCEREGYKMATSTAVTTLIRCK